MMPDKQLYETLRDLADFVVSVVRTDDEGRWPEDWEAAWINAHRALIAAESRQ